MGPRIGTMFLVVVIFLINAVRRVIVISGCDSGLGWATAARIAREGDIAVAGLHGGIDTKSAITLRRLKAITLALDVTDNKSIHNMKVYISDLLRCNPSYKLHALVNNAGVMTVGEFEWLTMSMIERQVAVNILGAMKLTNALLPELRKSAMMEGDKPRIINIVSHCALQPLPNFAVYSATKGGLMSWSEALRIELQPRGIEVVNFIPGSFVSSSNIMQHQTEHFNEMDESFNDEQKKYFEPYFKSMKDYLSSVSTETSFDAMKDFKLLNKFMRCINDSQPKYMYKVEPWRYWFYFKLFNLPLFQWVRAWLVKKFISFPPLK